MESKIIHEFVARTGCESDVAYTLLQSKSWDFDGALSDWKYLNTDATGASADADAGAGENVNYDRKLTRGISRATDNLPLVLRARNQLELQEAEDIGRSDYTFALPDLTVYCDAEDEFKQFLEQDLIEKSTLVSLESSNRLNWWTSSHRACPKLWPLSTNGDGNCLLHSASLSIWGFHDRLLTLRRTLYNYLKRQRENSSQVYRRWRYQQTITNKQNNLILSEDEWATEWMNIVEMASTEPTSRASQSHYHSLEEVHVLALSMVLRRPIIVISNTVLNDLNGEPLSPITFGGIYLPFNRRMPLLCSPLLLSYDNGHFSSLVTMDTNTTRASNAGVADGDDGGDVLLVPLVDSNYSLLPIQYNYDPASETSSSSTNDVDVDDDLIESTEASAASAAVVVDWNALDYVNYNGNDFIEYNMGLLRQHLDVVHIDMVFESNDVGDQQHHHGDHDRLQTVVKQFGSIGKSMSKKLKKNLNKIITTSNASNTSNTNKLKINNNNNNNNNRMAMMFVCCKLNVIRHEYQNDMINNYIEFAYKRYQSSSTSTSASTPDNTNSTNNNTSKQSYKCINCNRMSGSIDKSYMCYECYHLQYKQELNSTSGSGGGGGSGSGSGPHYGTGKSKFYTTSTNDNINTNTTTLHKCNINPTLYLSKSTFYNDTGTQLFNNNNTNNSNTSTSTDNDINKQLTVSTKHNSTSNSTSTSTSNVCII